MIYIRVDGNETIASGHVMRCMAIAEELVSGGEHCTFICADEFSKDIIISKGYKFICLNSKWNKLNLELDKMLQLIEIFDIEKLLIDSYSVTEIYLKTLKKKTQVIYLDDRNAFNYSVDMLIVYSGIQNTVDYNALYADKQTRLLLGFQYAPLRREFSNVKNVIKPIGRVVLITTGSSDPFHIIERILLIMLEEETCIQLQFNVIMGKFFTNKDRLIDLAKKYKNIKLIYSVDDMSKLMSICDVAVSAGGTTLLELCSCGTPTICFAMADNQLELVQQLEKNNIVYSVGDVRKKIELKVYEVVRKTINLLDDFKARKRYHNNMIEVTDGKGARYIAEQILNLQDKRHIL